jgi:hypothetical protein
MLLFPLRRLRHCSTGAATCLVTRRVHPPAPPPLRASPLLSGTGRDFAAIHRPIGARSCNHQPRPTCSCSFPDNPVLHLPSTISSCCPLAPAHHSASGLAINICDVLVEEGGPRVEAKRRGGDPLPRASCRAKFPERAGSRSSDRGSPHERRPQTSTYSEDPYGRTGDRTMSLAALQPVDARRPASAKSEGRSYVMRRGSQTDGSLRSAGGRLGVRLIIQSPARTCSRLANSTRSLAG